MAYDPTKNAGQSADSIDPSVTGQPFIGIVQKGSPEFDETHRQHAQKKIKDCKPGNIVFQKEKLILAQPTLIIPVAQTTIYSEWRPRDQQGGFVGHQPLSIVTDRAYTRGAKGSPNENKEYLGSNELIYTVYVMVLFKYKDEWKKGMISFTQTQLKHARNWLKSIASVRYEDLPDVTPPVFAAVYQLSTFIDSNTKGSWYAWKIALDRVLDLTKEEDLLKLAEEASGAALQSLPAPGRTAKEALPAPAGGTGDPY